MMTIEKFWEQLAEDVLAEELDEAIAALPPQERAAGKRKSERANATSVAPTAKRKRIEDPLAPTIETIELIDLAVLRALHAQRGSLLSNRKGEQTKFHNFFTNTVAANGQRTVRYQQKLSGERFGRFSPCNGLSFQNMDRSWRDTLIRDRDGALLYEQLDMRKAHQSILLSIAEHNGWETPRLRHYIDHSEEVLDMLVFEREQAKTVMLMLLYGGNAAMASGHALPPFVEAYRAEMCGIAARLYEANPELVRRLQINEPTEYKRMYVFMSRLLQDREAQCMQAAVAFLVGAGWKIGALLHDGIMVHRRAERPIDSALLEALRESIFSACRIRHIEFRVKEFGEPLPVQLQQAAN